MKKERKRRKVRPPKNEVDLLKDLLITQLGMAGVRQGEIRKIVVCEMGRVTTILKQLKKAKKGKKGELSLIHI